MRRIDLVMKGIREAIGTDDKRKKRDALDVVKEEIMSSFPLPKEPPLGLLESMATRMRHDFGLDADDTSPMSSGFTEREREVLLNDMRKIYEEVSGHGFYQWPKG
jgi:hypothetical protein